MHMVKDIKTEMGLQSYGKRVTSHLYKRGPMDDSMYNFGGH